MGRSSSGKQIAVLLGATKLDHLSTHCISCEHQQPPNPKATNGKQQHIAGLEASHGLRWFVGFPRRLCSGTGDASFAWWQAQPHTLGGCKSGSGARLTASSASLQELVATKSSAKPSGTGCLAGLAGSQPALKQVFLFGGEVLEGARRHGAEQCS